MEGEGSGNMQTHAIIRDFLNVFMHVCFLVSELMRVVIRYLFLCALRGNLVKRAWKLAVVCRS